MPIIMPSPITGKKPQIDETTYIAPTAVIIGDVTIGEWSNVWFGAVIRGDHGPIKIGKNTSIQEHVTIHIEEGTSVIIGSMHNWAPCDDPRTSRNRRWMFAWYRE